MNIELKATRYMVENGIATISLHRPNRMNAWTGRMHTEYRHCLIKANMDNKVRAIVITGSGKGFCVGGDSRALEGHIERGAYDPGTPDDMPTPGYGIAQEFDANFAYHFGLQKPVVAALNGPAAGVGLALACFADIRFAAKGVKLTTAHGKLNLPAEYGLSWLLPRMIGLARANDLLLTSRVFLAEEAKQFGLVNEVFSADTLMDNTYEYVAKMIASVSPDSLRQTRWQIYKDLHRGVGESVFDSEQLIKNMMKAEDYAEGVSAFLEKRSPNWVLPTK
ncbi:MAG: enoyl-CoA hydratase/isomerase family protein [Pseudomonadales bacterium]|nr:enoyl-CoA hydratase/isomerase family protein [Pseudomonadales bacterium]